MIEHIRTKGHPLDNIVRKFDAAVNSETNASETSNTTYRYGTSRSVTPASTLSLADITSPAILTDTDLNIIWQNQKAAADIWRDSAIVPREGLSVPSVFDILFSNSFQSVVDNWRQWAAFFLQQAIARTSFDHLEEIVESQPQNRREVLASLIATISKSAGPGFPTRRMRLVLADGRSIYFWVAAIDTHVGRLTVFEPDTGDATLAGYSKISDGGTPASIDIGPEPVERHLHVIALRLDHAEILQTETLAGEYVRIVSHVRRTCIDCIERSGAVAGLPDGDHLVGYFIPTAPVDDTPFNLIQCALELKNQMTAIEREWKLRKGWLHRIELSIGLHSSREYVGSVTTSKGNNVTTFGDGLRVAAAMAAVSGDGHILVSKAMINCLPADTLQRLRFGVYRSESGRRFFVSNSFSRICDLDDGGGIQAPASRLISALPVTRLFENQES